MTSVKLNEFEAKIFTELNPLLTVENSQLTPTHPRSLKDLQECKTVVVLGYLSDAVEGTIISQAILQPSYSFVVYGSEYLLVKAMQEKLIDIFCNQIFAYTLTGGNVRCTSIAKLRRSPIVFLNQNEMYSASVDYRFFISAC